jgi:hypothetical protein
MCEFNNLMADSTIFILCHSTGAPTWLQSRSRINNLTGLFYVIPLMMEAVHTSEKSVYFYETAQRYIPEDVTVILSAKRV